MDQVKQLINSSRLARWTVLIMVSLLMFATYWFQDFFGPLQGLMRDSWGFTNADFGLVISATTWLNLLGGIIVGGIILDKLGAKACIFIFGGLAVAGAAVCAIGAAGIMSDTPDEVIFTFLGQKWTPRILTIVLGRMLFGPGLEVTCVLVTKTVVKWFKGYELALAMGINMAFGRLGSAFALGFSLDIAGVSPSPAFTFAAVLIGIGLVAFIAHLMFDTKLEHQRKELAAANNETVEDEKFHWSDLVKLITNPSFLFITLLCVAFYSAVFPFIQYAPDLLVNKFNFSSTLPQTSGLLATIKAWLTNGPKVAMLIPLGTILFTPLFGRLIDKKGKAASIMMLGAGLLIFAHLSLSVFNNVILGYAGLLALGVAFSLVPSAMWPSVAKIVPESRLGTAYATMFTIQNWGLMSFFYGIGRVLDWANVDKLDAIAAREAAEKAARDAAVTGEQVGEVIARTAENTYDYTVPILMLVVLGVISIFLAFMLKVSDKRQGYGLELPSGHTPEK